MDSCICKRYSVPVKFVFNGTILVRAFNEKHAKEIVESTCHLNYGKFETNLIDEEAYWTIDMKSKTIASRARRV